MLRIPLTPFRQAAYANGANFAKDTDARRSLEKKGLANKRSLCIRSPLTCVRHCRARRESCLRRLSGLNMSDMSQVSCLSCQKTVQSRKTVKFKDFFKFNPLSIINPLSLLFFNPFLIIFTLFVVWHRSTSTTN